MSCPLAYSALAIGPSGVIHVMQRAEYTSQRRFVSLCSLHERPDDDGGLISSWAIKDYDLSEFRPCLACRKKVLWMLANDRKWAVEAGFLEGIDGQ